MPRCPRGHDTAAADYCDDCGSPLSVLVSPTAASPASSGDEPCPECVTTQTGRFCEVCGRDRQVGATAETLKARAASAPDAAAATGTLNGWLVVTWANRDYHAHMIASAPQFAELADIPDNYPNGISYSTAATC
jgi:hypothetical protein